MKNKDITFVVQGPLREECSKTLQSIREHFPGSIIILSTWLDSISDNLEYDILIKSSDPGSLNIKKNGKNIGSENTNRQIKSTYEGLLKVNTEYAVKIRTDTPILNNNIINLFYEAQRYIDLPHYKKVTERILISSINTIDPQSSIKFPFHISDWFFFGRTEDLLKIWNGKLIPNDDYFLEQDISERTEFPRGFCFGRYTAEQLISLSFLSNFDNITFRHYCDLTDDNITKSIKWILSNFYVVTPHELGIEFKKYDHLINLKLNLKNIKNYLGFHSVTINKTIWRFYFKKHIDHTLKLKLKEYFSLAIVYLFRIAIKIKSLLRK